MNISSALENYFRWTTRIVFFCLVFSLIISNVESRNGLAYLSIGLLLLIPVGRVLITAAYAYRSREKGLLITSCLVILGLAISFFIGHFFRVGH